LHFEIFGWHVCSPALSASDITWWVLCKERLSLNIFLGLSISLFFLGLFFFSFGSLLLNCFLLVEVSGRISCSILWSWVLSLCLSKSNFFLGSFFLILVILSFDKFTKFLLIRFIILGSLNFSCSKLFFDPRFFVNGGGNDFFLFIFGSDFFLEGAKFLCSFGDLG